MRALIACVVAALIMLAAPAHAEVPRRVALVIGNQAYQSLSTLDNPRLDAGQLAELLKANGFDVLSCDGQRPGCFDVKSDDLRYAIDTFRDKADGADLALVFYAGHGFEGRDGNVLAPVDMEVVDCTKLAHKIVILDACRNDPLAQCPVQRGPRPLSFRPLSVPEAESYVRVSSTTPGQVASDGVAGAHSPYARALLTWLQKELQVYLDQVLMHAAKDVIDETYRAGLTQVPEMVVRGSGLDACLKGAGCVGDALAATLKEELEASNKAHARDQELAAVANDYLATVAKGRTQPLSKEQEQAELQTLKEMNTEVVTVMFEAEKGRGRSLSAEERAQEFTRIMEAGRALIARNDTRSERALERWKAGDETEADRLFAEVAAAREQAAHSAQARAAEENRGAAKAWRHRAALVRPKNAAKAADSYKEAVRLDPGDAQTWTDYARAANAAGRRADAKAAFEQADLKAREKNDPLVRYLAALGLGDMSTTLFGRAAEERHYRAALALAEEAAKADASNIAWERRLATARCRIAGMLYRQDNLPAAVESYQGCRATRERLASAEPGNDESQQNLAWMHDSIGALLKKQGNFAGALASYQAALDIAERQGRSHPNSAQWLDILATVHGSISGLHAAQHDLAAALASSQTALGFNERIVEIDPTNALSERALAWAHFRIAELRTQTEDRSGALASYQAARAITERLVEMDPESVIFRVNLSTMRRKIGDVLSAQGDRAGALASYRQAATNYERYLAGSAVGGDPPPAAVFIESGYAASRIGQLLAADGDVAGAMTSYRAAIAAFGHVDPGISPAQGTLFWAAQYYVGMTLMREGDLAGALVSFRAMQSVAEQLVRSDAGNASYQTYLMAGHALVGSALHLRGDLPGARASYQAMLALDAGHAAADADSSDKQVLVWLVQFGMGNVLYDQGHLAEALARYAEAEDTARRQSKADPGNPKWQRNLAVSLSGVAGVRLAKGNRAGALALFRQALAIDEASAAAVEQDETKSAGKPGAKTAEALRYLGWQAALARDTAKGLAATERASALAPDLVWPDLGRAHAALLSNRPREAKALYLANKGKGKSIDDDAWEWVVANDFRALRRAGLGHPMMREVEVALGVAPMQPPPTAAIARKAIK